VSDAIAPVVHRMERIAAGLPTADGVARFNELYLAVTRAVGREAAAGEFEDATFLTRLDVVFADLYFAAVDADEAGRRAGHAWRPLFDARRRPKVAPLQFALAGMNAHINHDLPVALVATMLELGLEPRRDTPHHRDFCRVDAILARVETSVKEHFQDELLDVADEALGRVDDVVAMWSVERARDAAWTNAEALWALRGEPAVRDAFLLSLGRLVGLGSRGLLLPTL
jgi:Family of unknown function (DUF5995)